MSQVAEPPAVTAFNTTMADQSPTNASAPSNEAGTAPAPAPKMKTGCSLCGDESKTCGYVVDEDTLPLNAAKSRAPSTDETMSSDDSAVIETNSSTPSIGETTPGGSPRSGHSTGARDKFMSDVANEVSSTSGTGETVTDERTKSLLGYDTNGFTQISHGGKLLPEYANRPEYDTILAFLATWYPQATSAGVEIMDVNEVENAPAVEAEEAAPTLNKSATSSDINMDDAATPTTGSVKIDGPPPSKKAKTAKQYFKKRTPIFPVSYPVPCRKGKDINSLPLDVMFYFVQQLLPPTLVALAQTCSTWYQFLSSPSLDHTVWRRARERYGDPMPAPNVAIDSGSGVSKTELNWAMWMFGGGKCAFCDRWTYTPPASFALNIHVCLMQECRSHWRKQCKQCVTALNKNANLGFLYIQVAPKAPKKLPKSGKAVPQKQPSRPVETAYGGLKPDEILVGHPDYDEKDETHELLPAIASEKTLCSLMLNHPSLRTALTKVDKDIQPQLLRDILESTANRKKLGLHEDDRVDDALPIAVKLHEARKKKKDKKKKPLPEFLGELGSVHWPHGDSTLKQLVKVGLPFVECGPTNSHNKTKWGLPVHQRRKYKLTDLHRALEEWQDAERNGTRAELIDEWYRRASVLEDKIIVAQLLMKWRDNRKKALDNIRMRNDHFLREVTGSLELEWHDASNSPTLVQLRHLCELSYEFVAKKRLEEKIVPTDNNPLATEWVDVVSGSIEEQWDLDAEPRLWSTHKFRIVEESRLLNARRTNREFQNKKHTFRDLRVLFHEYCARNTKHLDVTILPPFAVFEKLVGVTRVIPMTPPVAITSPFPAEEEAVAAGTKIKKTMPPELQVNLARWHFWEEHVKKDLQVWEKKVKAILSAVAGVSEEGLDHPTCLFRCETCDAATNQKNTNTLEHTQLALDVYRARKAEQVEEVKKKKVSMDDLGRMIKEKAKKHKNPAAHRPTPMPNYHAPMAWKEIVSHKCTGWDVAKFKPDIPATRLAHNAIGALTVGKNVSVETLRAVGRAWKCETCTVPLSWDELYMHSLRHVWTKQQCHSYPIPSKKVFPNDIWRSIGDVPIKEGDDEMSLEDRIDDDFGMQLVQYFPPVLANLPANVNLSAAPMAGDPLAPANFCKTMTDSSRSIRDKARLGCTHCYVSRGGGRPMNWDALKDHMKQKHDLPFIVDGDVLLITRMEDLQRWLVHQEMERKEEKKKAKMAGN